MNLKVDNLETRLQALEGMAFIESLSVLGGDSSSLLASISSAIDSGLVKLKELTSGHIIIEKNADPRNNSIGRGIIKAGETEARIESNQVRSDSEIFVTFRSDYQSRWWIEQQEDGFFIVKIKEPLTGDISFSWWVIGVAEPFVESSAIPDVSPEALPASASQIQGEQSGAKGDFSSSAASESPAPTESVQPAEETSSPAPAETSAPTETPAPAEETPVLDVPAPAEETPAPMEASVTSPVAE